MELRRYWQIILRYWWLVLLLTLVGIAAGYQYYITNRPDYANTIVVNIARTPAPTDNYSGYYGNVSSEYSSDDFVAVVKGSTFLNDVSNLLKSRNLNLSVADLKGAIEAERKNRQLYVTAHSPDKAKSLAINRAVAEVLVNKAGSYLAYNSGPQPIQANIIDLPGDAQLTGGRTVLLAAVRPIVGLIVGLALAFLLAYLDNSIRTEAEVHEVLGLPVLASVPKVGRAGSNSNSKPTGSSTSEAGREAAVRR